MPNPRALSRARRLIVALGLLLGLVASCSRSPSIPPATAATPNFLLITIDTLRADHLGCYGYFRDTSPNLDRLAGESLLFERAYTPMATTLPAHVSLLTGLNPLEHGVLANQEHGGSGYRSRPGARSIAEILKAEGYATGAFVSAAPIKRPSGIAAGFDTFVEPKEAQCRGGLTTEAALRWIETHADGRMFLWIHYYDPHWPREPPEPYKSRYRDEPELHRFLEERRIPEFVGEAPCKLATDTRQAINAYDGAIRYVDDQVQRVLDAFRERGLWDKTVVVVTSDHGEGLNQHDWPAHGRVWEEQARVPLLMRFAGEPPRRIATLTSLIDVVPTVLARTEMDGRGEFAAQASGVDVLAPGFEGRPVLSQRTGRDCGDDAGPIFSWTTTHWKYFHQPKLGDRLFDLTADPFELDDRSKTEATVRDGLREALLAAIADESARGATLADDGGGEHDTIDPELREQLESLGYVGGEPVGLPGERAE